MSDGSGDGPSPPVRTMEDFAAIVGLSRPTVSKFFHDPDSVRRTTRGRIEAAIKMTGFRPNIFAVNLNRRRTTFIGLIIPDRMDPFYMSLARRIETSAAERGYLALVLSSNGRPDLEEQAIERIAALNVSGAIIAPLGVKSHRSKLKALAKRFPLVFVDAPLDDEEPFVGTDHRQTITLLTDYLARAGAPPCFFDIPAGTHNALERRRHYERAMIDLGLEPKVVSTPASWDFERVCYETALAALGDGGLPTRSVLCGNDRVAFGVMAAINSAGLSIGVEGDYRVAGHDNQPFAAFTWPPLTTVAQNTERMGEVAFRILMAKMQEADAAPEGDRVRLKGELVVRRSA